MVSSGSLLDDILTDLLLPDSIIDFEGQAKLATSHIVHVTFPLLAGAVDIPVGRRSGG